MTGLEKRIDKILAYPYVFSGKSVFANSPAAMNITRIYDTDLTTFKEQRFLCDPQFQYARSDQGEIISEMNMGRTRLQYVPPLASHHLWKDRIYSEIGVFQGAHFLKMCFICIDDCFIFTAITPLASFPS